MHMATPLAAFTSRADARLLEATPADEKRHCLPYAADAIMRREETGELSRRCAAFRRPAPAATKRAQPTSRRVYHRHFRAPRIREILPAEIILILPLMP